MPSIIIIIFSLMQFWNYLVTWYCWFLDSLYCKSWL